MPCEAAAKDVSLSAPALHRDVPGVVWRYVGSADWPAEAEALDALADKERQVLGTLRHPDRRRQWLAGRFVAKQMLREMECLGDVALAAMRIDSRDAAGKGSPPVVLIEGERLPVRLSLAHTGRGVLAACGEAGVSVGVDLVDVDAASRPEALATWFTPAEAAAIDRTSQDDAAAQWAVKEAVYKSVCVDEPFAPKQVEAIRTAGGWRCRFFGRSVENLRVDLRRIDGQLGVIAASLDPHRARPGGSMTDELRT